MKTNLGMLEFALDAAKKAGADAVDAMYSYSSSLQVKCRDGKFESSSRSDAGSLGLRVFVGQRSTIVSSTDLSCKAITTMAERATSIAALAPEDPFAGLLPTSEISNDFTGELELYDDTGQDADRLLELATGAEDSALSVAGVTQSQGSGCNQARLSVALATSNGFAGEYVGSNFSAGVSVVAGSGDAMGTDHFSHTARFLEDLMTVDEIGRRAGEGAARLVAATSMPTGVAPVLFDRRIAASLLAYFAAAINGAAIARKASFLKESLGEAVFPTGISIVDDALLVRGIASRPFDGEGAASLRLELVEDGVLRSWILDAATARQLQFGSTGSARRSATTPPSPGSTNLFVVAGRCTVGELMSDIVDGLYVTGLQGQGVNGVTGDFSMGAKGFRIQSGEITTPVNGITVAGNLKEMFASLTVADDLEFNGTTNCPTARVEQMTIAGG